MGRNVRFRKVYLKHHLSLTVLKTYSSVSTFLIHLINSIWLFYHTTDISIIRIGTVPNRTVPYATVSYRTVPYHTVPYRTLQYCTVLYRTVILRGPIRVGLKWPLKSLLQAEVRYSVQFNLNLIPLENGLKSPGLKSRKKSPN